MAKLPGALAVVSLLLTGCGDARPTATDAEPTPSQTTPTSVPPEPSTTTSTAADEPPPVPGSASALGEVIPADFPLLSGLPEDSEAEPGEGRRGPNRTMRPIVPEACGERVPLPDHTDRLRAAWTNPEDGRDRQLVTFTDVASAQLYAEQVLDLFRACPEEVTSEGAEESRRVTVVDSDLGDFAGAASTQYLLYDYPAPGLTTWTVVRVGAAVLTSVTYNEGGAGADPDQQAADQRRRDAQAIAGVVDAMSTLVEDHPSEPPFGPSGVGRFTLGMSRAELLALPGVRITGDNGVCEDFESAGVVGHLQPGLGVAVLSAHGDLETPEHVHLGSTLAEVRAAYPDGAGDEVWFDAPPYRFELGRDRRVISMMLLHPDQRCGS
ncbi:hypothetical protein [Nocardioides sp.]|uniref:hypothetical protein n=1 Tax=Nocardioides sp. TaxID=35761 RepID=UPI0025E033FE|nr:hypothetical protein [Nocardioides sp.]